MRRWSRFAVMALLTLAPNWSGPAHRPVLGRYAHIKATPVAFDPENPARRRAGALTFLGGMELTSDDPAFGGFSSLMVGQGKFTLLSDGGNIAIFHLRPGLRVKHAIFRDLPGGPGTGWYKSDRDSESMTADLATGQIWVGFEHSNAIGRFARGFETAEDGGSPPPMRDWSDNGGAESLVRLRDGRFLTIAETDRRWGSNARNAILFAGDPVAQPDRWVRFGYVPPDGFDPSDAAELPDGRLVVLNRRLDFPFVWSAVLTVIDPAQIKPGVILRGVEIARLAPPLSVDNFEGVAVTREGAATILWLVSDDNLFVLQRTLLFKFRLDLPETPPARSPKGERAG